MASIGVDEIVKCLSTPVNLNVDDTSANNQIVSVTDTAATKGSLTSATDSQVTIKYAVVKETIGTTSVDFYIPVTSTIKVAA